MDLQLANKVAVITGASRGIGRAVAEVLAEEGCNLVLAARNAEDLDRLAGTLRDRSPVDVRVAVVDLANAQDRERLVDLTGPVDILVNNAGAIPGGSIDDFPDDRWQQVWGLKVFGYLSLTRLYYASMKERGGGVIANVIGTAGERPKPDYIAGSTGNAGLIAFTRALGASSPSDGIRVVGVNPGLTGTERAVTMLQSWSAQRHGTADQWQQVEKDLDLPFGRMGTPREVANAVAFLVSPMASYISGTVLTVDGGAASRAA